MAKRIGNGTGDDVTDLFVKIRDDDFSEIHTERPPGYRGSDLRVETPAHSAEVDGKYGLYREPECIFYFDLRQQHWKRGESICLSFAGKKE